MASILFMLHPACLQGATKSFYIGWTCELKHFKHHSTETDQLNVSSKPLSPCVVCHRGRHTETNNPSSSHSHLAGSCGRRPHRHTGRTCEPHTLFVFVLFLFTRPVPVKNSPNSCSSFIALSNVFLACSSVSLLFMSLYRRSGHETSQA